MTQHENEDTDYVEVNVTYLMNSIEAIYIEDARGRKMWIPKSQISAGYDPDTDRYTNITLTIPEWVAQDRGLI